MCVFFSIFYLALTTTWLVKWAFSVCGAESAKRPIFPPCFLFLPELPLISCKNLSFPSFLSYWSAMYQSFIAAFVLFANSFPSFNPCFLIGQ